MAYRLKYSEEKYIDTSLSNLSKIFKIKPNSIWYRLKNLENLGCIKKEAKFAKNGGTRLMLTEEVNEIFRNDPKFSGKRSNLHLSEELKRTTGRKFVNQEMLAELNELTGWDIQMNRQLARYFNGAFLRKFKTLEKWRIYLKTKIINASKIVCRTAFLLHILNFGVIDEVLAKQEMRDPEVARLEVQERLVQALNPTIKPDIKKLNKFRKDKAEKEFALEILRKLKTTQVLEYSNIESCAFRHRISLEQIRDIVGVKSQDFPNQSTEGVLKRDFWKKYGKAKAISWMSKVRIWNLCGVVNLECDSQFTQDYIQENFQEWVQEIKRRHSVVWWTTRTP